MGGGITRVMIVWLEALTIEAELCGRPRSSHSHPYIPFRRFASPGRIPADISCSGQCSLPRRRCAKCGSVGRWTGMMESVDWSIRTNDLRNDATPACTVLHGCVIWRTRIKREVSNVCVLSLVRRTYSNFGDRCFAAAGPRMWNSLPAGRRQTDIAAMNSLSSCWRLICLGVEIAAHCGY